MCPGAAKSPSGQKDGVVVGLSAQDCAFELQGLLLVLLISNGKLLSKAETVASQKLARCPSEIAEGVTGGVVDACMQPGELCQHSAPGG